MNKKRRKGFTLIELLVVIAIIAILMAILLPALKKAKDMAKTTLCRGNLRQLGIINHGYTESYNFYFPSSQRTEGAGDVPLTGQMWWEYMCDEFKLTYTSGDMTMYTTNNRVSGAKAIFSCPSSDS